MKMKRLFLPFAMTALLFGCTNASLPQYKFRHQQARNDYDSSLFYSDDFFKDSSIPYHPSLATTSESFAMASFASCAELANYKRRYRNAEDLLKKLGFESFSVNHDYEVQPGMDTIGLIHAKKKIGDATLIACGIRGGNYEREWASNFTIGDREDGFHDGFKVASDAYIESLRQYIASENITGPIKLWASGYSRGGAVTNLAFGRLDEGLRDKKPLLGDNVTYTADDLYCYCFEPPMGAPRIRGSDGAFTVHSQDFANIHNIVNINDPVPYLAMKELDFTRYGVDCFLPDPLNTVHFEEYAPTMKRHYHSMSNHAALGNYLISDFESYTGLKTQSKSPYRAYRHTQAMILQGLSSHLSISGAKNRPFYTENIQKGLREVLSLVFGSGAFRSSLIDVGLAFINDLPSFEEVQFLLEDIQRTPEFFVQDACAFLQNGLNKVGVSMDASTFVKDISGFLEAIKNTLVAAFLNGQSELIYSLFSKDNLKSVASGHYSELCQAHLRAMDPLWTTNPMTFDSQGHYRKVIVQGDLPECRLFSGDTTLFACRDDGTVESQIPATITHDAIYLYFPKDAHYTLHLANKDAAVFSDIVDLWNDRLVQESIPHEDGVYQF